MGTTRWESPQERIRHRLTAARAARFEAARQGAPDDALTRAASAVLRARLRESGAADDLAAFGAPAECMGLVARGIARGVQAAIREAGLDPDTFNALVAGRISGKAVWRLGLAV
jgi:hypothetical protein